MTTPNRGLRPGAGPGWSLSESPNPPARVDRRYLNSRLNDKLTGAIVLIMHRPHESPPSGGLCTRLAIMPSLRGAAPESALQAARGTGSAAIPVSIFQRPVFMSSGLPRIARPPE